MLAQLTACRQLSFQPGRKYVLDIIQYQYFSRPRELLISPEILISQIDFTDSATKSARRSWHYKD
jgi:hypothetical protein